MMRSWLAVSEGWPHLRSSCTLTVATGNADRQLGLVAIALLLPLWQGFETSADVFPQASMSLLGLAQSSPLGTPVTAKQPQRTLSMREPVALGIADDGRQCLFWSSINIADGRSKRPLSKSSTLLSGSF